MLRTVPGSWFRVPGWLPGSGSFQVPRSRVPVPSAGFVVSPSLQSSLRRTWNSEPRNQEPLNPRGTWNERGTRNPTWNPEPGIGTIPNQVSTGVRERRSHGAEDGNWQRATLDGVGVPDAPRSAFRIRPSFRISHSEFRTRVLRPPPDYRLDEAFEACRGIARAAGVDRGHLHDGAPGRHQPAESRAAGQLANRPRRGPPRHTTGMMARFARMTSRSASGSSASTAGPSSSIRASRKSRSGQERITPALICSPRSTRGTTRTIA